MDGQILIVIVVCVIVLIFVAVKYANNKRREELTAKYGDANLVEIIMQKKIFQGMSTEQLIDSWGHPVAKDHKVLKTKFCETFKYNQNGRNRFASRVMLENGIVVGWKQNG